MAMRLAGLVAVLMSVLAALVVSAADAQSQWEKPAAALAEQIAGILGPGQARLTMRNVSSLPESEVPAIRQLMEQDLKAHGIAVSGAESANAIRVTLSENARERLWVAEVMEGEETRVAMAQVDAGSTPRTQSASGMTLRAQTIFSSREPVLAALETASGLVIVEPEAIVISGRAANGWQEEKRVTMVQRHALARDARAVIWPAESGTGFEASLAGMACSGSYASGDGPAAGGSSGAWSVKCAESDDPWKISAGKITAGKVTAGSDFQASATSSANVSVAPIKAFYNAARNYFTGVLAPSMGVDLPAFYSFASIPRPAGVTALLIDGIDGKVQLVENGALKAVSGTRDWGSDLAALHSGCGGGDQVLASGGGEAASDSLRAYEIPALEAVPASTPLAMNGTVMALWTAPDGKSAYASVRQGNGDYEVDRVTALCD
jgi:hypothetical protein